MECQRVLARGFGAGSTNPQLPPVGATGLGRRGALVRGGSVPAGVTGQRLKRVDAIRSGDALLLELDCVTKRFTQADGSRLTVLREASLTLRAGDTLAVAGRSGSGKSTLLHLAAGIETPSEGAVRLLGRELGGLSDPARSRLRGRKVGLIFQSFHLLPYLTVRENVLLPARIHRVREAPGPDGALEPVGAAADRLLREVGLDDRSREPARILSGGEMQRTAIARALLLAPSLVLADEPTGSLDAGSAAAVTDLLFRLVRERRLGLILATHDPELAARCAIRLRLRDGRLGSGSADQRPPA